MEGHHSGLGWSGKALFCCSFISLEPTFLNMKGSEKLKVTPSTHSLMLDQGMGMEVAHFLQPTSYSEESDRACNPCPDQWEKDGNWAAMGLTGAQGYARPKGT